MGAVPINNSMNFSKDEKHEIEALIPMLQSEDPEQHILALGIIKNSTWIKKISKNVYLTAKSSGLGYFVYNIYKILEINLKPFTSDSELKVDCLKTLLGQKSNYYLITINKCQDIEI